MPTLVVLSSMALGGCAAAWGSPYKVEFSSSSSVTVNFDPSFASMGDVQAVAQKICDSYGKDAIPQASNTSPWGMQSMSFLCQRRT